MSSLRLALKQSLQESGGGTFSSGHGDKKKRKKKKNSNNLALKKGSRDASSKRKRGRPRKHPRSQRDDEMNDEDPRKHQHRSKPEQDDVDDDEDDEGSFSENEFSYNDDYSGEDYDESDEDDETEDGSPYRSRSRAPLDDEEGEFGMQSEEDEQQVPKGVSTTKSNDAEKPLSAPSLSETKERNSLVTGEIHVRLEEHEPATTTTTNAGASSAEPKSASEVPPTGPFPNAEDEEVMMRKKLKLKLKKRLEKNQSQNSAASKIQNQWKKKKNNMSSPESKKQEAPAATATSATTVATSITTTAAMVTTNVEKDKTTDSKGNIESTSPKAEAKTSAPPKAPSPAVDLQQQQKLEEKGETKPVDGAKNEITALKSDLPSDSVAVKPSTSSAASGDKGSKKPDGGGEDEAPPTTSAKKHGYVRAPTREVKQWAANMKDKKSRKYIRIGMRVKVRFAIPVKRDGKSVTKKKFFGGKVAAISKNRTKIRIKYDDGTSEVSDFPDGDVYVDAVDNGEHAVPADKFIPPTQEEELEQPETEEVPVAAAAAPTEEQEEGEIPTPKAAAPPPAAPVPMETEEGEVQEDTKPKARAVESLDDSKKTITLKQPSAETPLPAKAEATKKPTDVPTTPPSNASSAPAALIKSEKINAGTSTKDDVQMEPAPSPSQEDGELSPGITVSKSSENLSEDQTTAPLAATAAESIPLPPKALLPSNIGSEKVTSEPIKFAAETPSQATAVNAIDADKGKEKADMPAKPKKLSIRIPSNSLATIKSLSSPKSNGSKSPLPPPSQSNLVEVSKADDVLKDTPETKKEVTVTTKRKRVSDDDDVAAAAPSLDEAPAQEPPAKRRIKVAIGKNLMDAAAASVAAKSESIEAGASNAPVMVVVEEQELAPIAEEPISAGETKKKKKRADRAKSPRPKSPLPVPEPEKIKSKTNSNSSETAPEATPKQQKIGSKLSAFSLKKSTKEDGTATKQANAAELMSAKLINAAVSLRTGRKAAEEAKEKLSVKQKAKLIAKENKEKEVAPLESSKKKKKRRREKEEEEHGEEPEEIEVSELEWVQCDSCKKWRALPDNVKASSLPDLWYCHMNVYDPKRNNCEAPEQNVKQLLRERKKKARKRQRREAELAESQQEKSTKKSKQLEEEIAAVATSKKKTKQEKLQAAASTPRSASPKPTKSAKSGKAKESAAESKKAIAEAKRANLEGGKKSKGVVEDAPNPTDSSSDTQKEAKKKGKKGKKESQDSSDNQDADDPKKGGRKRGRPSRNQPACTPVPTTPKNGGEDEDNVEWVQCDKCEKWRKLPPHISADELPDIWNCTMNTWNPSAASCDADEDKADAHHQEVGATEWQLRQTHAGKYSYRQMIFGTGARKHNRPMSERSRAAESLFIQPVTSDEQPYPTTQYTKSSAFLPRLTNFDKRNAIEENTIGIFDVLRHSNLWEDLRTMNMRPAKVLSSSTSSLNIAGQKLKTYDSLSDEIKHAMQDVVLQTLEFGCLTGDEITGKAQWFPYKTSIKGVAGIRGYCNENIIIHTLLDLVRDGLVEMATVRDPFRPVSQWVPRYRRVGTRRAFEAVEAIKASRCMKISKPWKQRSSKSTTTTEWVTGQKVV